MQCSAVIEGFSLRQWLAHLIMMQIIRRLLTCRIFTMHQEPGGAGWLGLGSVLMQEEVVWSEECPPSHAEPLDQSVSASLVRISSDVSSTQPDPVPGTNKDQGPGHVTRVTRGTFSDHDQDELCCQTSPCEGSTGIINCAIICIFYWCLSNFTTS